MKTRLYTVFTILIFIILAGKILNWFLHFSDETNQILNAAMFYFIGAAYIVMGYVWDNKLLKIIIMACGVFLIAMNFIGDNVALDIISIICIIVPMVVARTSKEKNSEVNVAES